MENNSCNNSGLFGVLHGVCFAGRAAIGGIKGWFDNTQCYTETQDRLVPGIYQDRKGFFRDKVTNQKVYYDPITNMLYDKKGQCVRNLEQEDWELRWWTLKQMYNREDIISALPSDKEFTLFPGRYYIDKETGHELVPRRIRVSTKSIWGYERKSSRTPEYNIPGDWIDYYVDMETKLLLRETDQHIYYRFIQRYEPYPDIYTNEYINEQMNIINNMIKENKIDIFKDFNVKTCDICKYYEQHPNEIFGIQVNYLHHPITEVELHNWYDTDYFHKLKYYKHWNEGNEHSWIVSSGGFRSNVGYSNWNELKEKYIKYAKINNHETEGYFYQDL